MVCILRSREERRERVARCMLITLTPSRRFTSAEQQQQPETEEQRQRRALIKARTSTYPYKSGWRAAHHALTTLVPSPSLRLREGAKAQEAAADAAEHVREQEEGRNRHR